jgi:hypothetical protein
MNVGIIIFAYNRGPHLAKTLDGLKANKEVKEIYLFQDGLKKEEHRAGWEATKKVIEAIDWCKVNYFLAGENKGLARSIVDGVNYVFNENDAIIVLEDDCVPMSNFISYMLQCLEKYKDNKQVYCISGSSWTIDVEKDKYDVYFTRRTNSCGWGTWKDRWAKYEIDNQILDRIKNDEVESLNLAMWGSDLEQMLCDRLSGRNDSWSVYWSLKVIELGGVCVAPYVSLINNIGFDGSGVHCGISDRSLVKLDDRNIDKFELSDDVVPRRATSLAFATLYGSYTAVNDDTSKKKILVYGVGNYFKVNEKYINDNFYIRAFIDKAKDGYYAGKKIIKLNQIDTYQFDAIVIMMQDIQECLNVAEMLRDIWGIPSSRILIGGCKFEKIV